MSLFVFKCSNLKMKRTVCLDIISVLLFLLSGILNLHPEQEGQMAAEQIATIWRARMSSLMEDDRSINRWLSISICKSHSEDSYLSGGQGRRMFLTKKDCLLVIDLSAFSCFIGLDDCVTESTH